MTTHSFEKAEEKAVLSQRQPYRVGLIGSGRAGLPRARAFDLHPRCEVVAVADTDPENLAFGSDAFGVPGYATWDAMFASQSLDIALAVLPVAPNADAVVAAAEAGVKAVFCEKPLTARLSDADRMVEACGARGVPLVAGLVISSHPDYRKAFELAASGDIGQVRRIHLYDGNGQGGCHGLNLARKFAAMAPVESVVGWVEGDAHSDFEEPYEEGDSGFGRIGGVIRFADGVECFSSWQDISWRGIEVVGYGGVDLQPQQHQPGVTALPRGRLLRRQADGGDGPLRSETTPRARLRRRRLARPGGSHAPHRTGPGGDPRRRHPAAGDHG
jgi:hypothetical protein